MSSSHNTTHTSSDHGKTSVNTNRRESKMGTHLNTKTPVSQLNASAARSRVSISTRRRAGSIQIGADKSSQVMQALNQRRRQIRIMDGDVDVTPEPLLQVGKVSNSFLTY